MKRALLFVLAGCFPYSSLPNDRPDPVLRKLADAKILDMKINLHKQPGLCPGKQGKLYVNATVQWPGQKPVLRSLGKDVDSFDPSQFAITGPLLQGDAQANLLPSADVQASIEAGFQTHVVYKLATGWTFDETFKPEYSCFTGFYVDGQGGDTGGGGNGGYNGNVGENGSPGQSGGRGSSGANGGRVTAYVTVVSTKYYERLYAVISNGTFFLAPADRQLTFTANGGAGGAGGGGGAGGAGGDQPTNTVEGKDKDGNTTTTIVGAGAAGNGGNGGNGGYGGDGGNGGSVDVVYDSAFPELRNFIATDVSGGAAGEGGAAGDGGNGGTTNAERNAQQGNAGSPGQAGGPGRGGSAGRAQVRAGGVANMFRSIHGMQILGGTPAVERPMPSRRRR